MARQLFKQICIEIALIPLMLSIINSYFIAVVSVFIIVKAKINIK